MRNRLSRALAMTAALVLGVTAVSCGGGGGSGSGDLVLVGFNLPNIAGVAMNQPLIFTFSDNVDPLSVTPDTLQVVGSPSFTFETIVVDGNLVAELPFIPNFEDYSDSGLAPGVSYSVFLPIFPAVDTVRSRTGKPLVQAEAFSFTTNPAVTFIEPRRPLVHSPGPFSGPNEKGDEDGCLQNPTNSLYTYPGFQFGTSPEALLLCLENEGQPRVLVGAGESIPTWNQRAVGTPSAVAPGQLDLPAIRVRFNEPLDPLTVVPYTPTTQLSQNVQLWRVGDVDANPILPVQVKTNKPIVVQDLNQAEAILVAVGPQPQGTYLVNIQGVKDLPGNVLRTDDRPDPADGGYAAIDAGLSGIVAPGYRIYFRTLQLPTTPGSITESFGNNLAERTAPLFTQPLVPTNPIDAIPGSPALGGTGFTLTWSNSVTAGGATSANWNGAYRYLGLTKATVNRSSDDGSGRLRAVFAPYLGNGDDGNLVVTTSTTLSSNSAAPSDANGDGIFEFESVTISAGGTLRIEGDRPLVMMVRGAFVCNGTIVGSGGRGGFGVDTDGTAAYTNAQSILAGGLGGTAGPGGGLGGRGAPKGYTPNAGDPEAGRGGLNLFGEVGLGGGAFGLFGDLQGATKNQAGGGGGYGSAGGGGGGGSAGGAAWNNADFTRVLSAFTPDRVYQPSANLAGGSGGGGGALDDDNGTNEAGNTTVEVTADGHLSGGDDGGGGGGGGGGALWVTARSINVGSTGVIRVDGGAGGNTFGPGEQTIVDPDPQTADDEVLLGVTDPNAAGTGHGGAGGGGSGGAILLQARDALNVAAGAVLSAVGGAGGTSSSQNGGAGGDGRIALMSFAGSADQAAGAFANAGSLTPVAGASGQIWKPTIDIASAGISSWINMVTTTAKFSTVTPFWSDNFGLLLADGLTQGAGQDFDALLEFQGADSLSPDSTNPTAATGLTAWTTDRTQIDGKIFVRWRWRFFVSHPDANPANDPDFNPAVNAMPAILDFTLPFQK